MVINNIPNELFTMFDEEIKNVWDNADKAINFDNIRIKLRENNALMSIQAGHLDRTSKAIGLSLRRKFGYDRPIILFVTSRSLELPEDKIRALLRHEALHIGYPRHDDNFRYYVKKINAPLTEYEMTSSDKPKLYTVSYQPKKGARFIKLKDFNDIYEAKTFSAEYSKKHMIKTRTSWMS